MAVYHSISRFTPEPDVDAAMFHLKKAGDCGVLKALYLLGCIHLQLPHTTLEILKVQVITFTLLYCHGNNQGRVGLSYWLT